MTLQDKVTRWEAEIDRLNRTGNRWGECRRFAGRSAGIRVERRRWLLDHLSDAAGKLRAAEVETV